MHFIFVAVLVLTANLVAVTSARAQETLQVPFGAGLSGSATVLPATGGNPAITLETGVISVGTGSNGVPILSGMTADSGVELGGCNVGT